MVKKVSISRAVFQTFNVLFLTGLVFACIAPVLHVIMASISDPGLLSKNTGLVMWPLGKANIEGYKYVFLFKNIWIGYRNTIFYVVVQCLVTGTMSAIAGYVLSRRRFKYRNVLMAFIAFTMLFNGGMIPTYMVVRNLGLIDTYAALIIPQALSVFHIIIMRTSMMSIPDSLEESARIDGANELTIMFRIVLPLVKSTFAVIVLFVAVAKWNEWFSALLYLSDSSKYPLQMFLRDILVKGTEISTSSDAVDKTQLYKTLTRYCVIVVSTLPIMCIYPFVQKHFVKGVMIGSVKG